MFHSKNCPSYYTSDIVNAFESTSILFGLNLVGRQHENRENSSLTFGSRRTNNPTSIQLLTLFSPIGERKKMKKEYHRPILTDLHHIYENTRNVCAHQVRSQVASSGWVVREREWATINVCQALCLPNGVNSRAKSALS